MRTYIFTKRERTIIQDFLDRKITLRNPALRQIRTRINTTTLSNDVKLYITLRVAISARST